MKFIVGDSVFMFLLRLLWKMSTLISKNRFQNVSGSEIKSRLQVEEIQEPNKIIVKNPVEPSKKQKTVKAVTKLH